MLISVKLIVSKTKGEIHKILAANLQNLNKKYKQNMKI